MIDKVEAYKEMVEERNRAACTRSSREEDNRISPGNWFSMMDNQGIASVCAPEMAYFGETGDFIELFVQEPCPNEGMEDQWDADLRLVSNAHKVYAALKAMIKWSDPGTPGYRYAEKALASVEGRLLPYDGTSREIDGG